RTYSAVTLLVIIHRTHVSFIFTGAVVSCLQVIGFADEQHSLLLLAKLIVFERFYEIPHFLILLHLI
ncbi:hypothetical protein, partial [Xylanibacter rodentium]|uniref:hypothetical protein n=1 Tax=Xylanibacter rodentium TaxID=2736289 RepID=UPI00259BDF8A